MVAGDRPLAVGVGPVVEGRVERVEGERLPGAAGRGVVAGVEDRLGAGRVADRAGDPVHADVVVPVGDEQDHGLALLRLAQVEVGGRLGGVAVERLALVVGADRALDQPPGLAGGDVAADLDLGRAPRGAARRGRGTSASGCHSSSLSRRLLVVAPRLATTTPTTTERQHQRRRPARLRGRAKSALPPLPADQQPDHDRHQRQRARRGPASRRPGRRAPPGPGPRALGLAGDQRVAVDQRRRCSARRSCRAVTETPTRWPVGTRTSGSTGPVSSTTWPDRSGPDHGVVAGQRGLAAAVEEDDAAAQARVSSDPGRDVRRPDQGPARPDVTALRRAPARPRRGRPRRRRRR